MREVYLDALISFCRGLILTTNVAYVVCVENDDTYGVMAAMEV